MHSVSRFSHLRGHAHLALLHIGDDLQVLNIRLMHGYRLQPYRLPDAGRRRVIDALRFANLFAAWLRAGVGWVVDTDDDLLLAVLFKRVGDVEAEGVVAAVMRTELLAVDPNCRFPIDRAEVQQRALAV